MFGDDNQTPIFSVIIPCYKVESFIEGSVESIVANGETDNIEIVMVDDGSPDKCGEKIDELSKKYSFIKAVHQENKGPGGARNAGLKQSRGEYIFFLDGDDRMVEGTLKNVCEVISNYPECDIIACSKHYYTNWEKSYIREENLRLLGLSQQDLRLRLAQNTYLGHNFYRRKMLMESNKPFSEGRKLGEDQHWILNNVAFAQKIKVLDVAFYYHYEKRPDSAVNGFSDDMRIDTLNMAGTIYRDTIILPYEEREKEILKHRASCLFMHSGAEIFVNCKNSEIQEKAKAILKSNRDILESKQNKWRFLMLFGRLIGLKGALLLYWKINKFRGKIGK